MRARRRKLLRPHRVSADEARSPSARSASSPHPVRMSQRGVRAAAEKACLEIVTTTKVSRHANKLRSKLCGRQPRVINPPERAKRVRRTERRFSVRCESPHGPLGGGRVAGRGACLLVGAVEILGVLYTQWAAVALGVSARQPTPPETDVKRPLFPFQLKALPGPYFHNC